MAKTNIVRQHSAEFDSLLRQTLPATEPLHLDGSRLHHPNNPPIPYIKHERRQGAPSTWDNFGSSTGRLYNEKWLEDRYAHILSGVLNQFVNSVNGWIAKNPEKTAFDGMTPRTSVNKFTKRASGKPAQSWWDHGMTIGHFAIDFVSPFDINRGKNGDFQWETQMYAEDVLGAGDIPVVNWVAPDRRAQRGIWDVHVAVTAGANVTISWNIH